MIPARGETVTSDDHAAWRMLYMIVVPPFVLFLREEGFWQPHLLATAPRKIGRPRERERQSDRQQDRDGESSRLTLHACLLESSRPDLETLSMLNASIHTRGGLAGLC